MRNIQKNIAFIGAGNMASSIIAGLYADAYPVEHIYASAPSETDLARVSEQFNISTSTDNKTTAAKGDIVVLAVKPQIMQEVCEDIREVLSSDTLLISVAAGISCASLSQWLGQGLAIVRCMSNTATQVLQGASGLFANKHVSKQQKEEAQSVLAAVGTTCWLAEEKLIDVVTAVAGSGPAYFFLFIEAMIDAAVVQGMDRSMAEVFAIQTAFGAAKLAKESDIDLVELRQRVTSPKGTTERAIHSFENNKLREIVAEAMDACRDRAQELGH